MIAREFLQFAANRAPDRRWLRFDSETGGAQKGPFGLNKNKRMRSNMLMTDGEYVSKLWHVVFRDSPLEVAAVVKQPHGSAAWVVRGRVRVRVDEEVGPGSDDLKYWFKSPPFDTEEEATAAWWLHLQGFMEESHLTILEQHEIVLQTASEEAVVKRLSQETFTHQPEPDSDEVTTRRVEVPPPASMLN